MGRPAQAEYRIDDLARAAGTSVRNVRAYQDRGLLHRPRRVGRVAVYDESHLSRLRIVGELLDRGYTLGNIKELLTAWDAGQSLDALLGLRRDSPTASPGMAESESGRLGRPPAGATESAGVRETLAPPPHRFLSRDWVLAAAAVVSEVRLPSADVGDGMVANILLAGPGDRGAPVEMCVETFAGRIALRPGQLPDCDLLIRADAQIFRRLLLEVDARERGAAFESAVVAHRVVVRGDLGVLFRLRSSLRPVAEQITTGIRRVTTAEP